MRLGIRAGCERATSVTMIPVEREAIAGVLAFTLACDVMPAAAQQPEAKPSSAAARKDTSKTGRPPPADRRDGGQ